MSDDNTPELGDVMEFPDGPRDDDRRWIVLYPEDYDNFGRDPAGNVAVLVDHGQAGEVLRLAAEVVADLSHRDAEGDDVLRDMVDALERQLDGEADD